jgi:hypothetical protein
LVAGDFDHHEATIGIETYLGLIGAAEIVVSQLA